MLGKIVSCPFPTADSVPAAKVSDIFLDRCVRHVAALVFFCAEVYGS